MGNTRFKNSFFPDAVKCWNDIGPEIRNLDKISKFKSAIMRMIQPEKKSIFNIHDPDLRYLYQLRVGLSPLKAHKFRHKFLDIPDGTCLCSSGVESTLHFLTRCPMFNNQRHELLASISPMTNKIHANLHDQTLVQTLLYGNKNLNQLQNQKILEATLSYIRNTGRFS